MGGRGAAGAPSSPGPKAFGQSFADCSPGDERGREAAAEKRGEKRLRSAQARRRLPSGQGAASRSCQLPFLEHSGAAASACPGLAERFCERRAGSCKGARGRGDGELRSLQLMARDGTQVRPGNLVAAGIQGPPCSLEDDEVFVGNEARPSATQADPFRHCSVEELYELLETLGSGHFGVVRRCQERSTGIFYAAKSIKVRKRKGSRLGMDREQVEREVCILQQLQHPNIMRLYDVFANQAEMVLILEFIQGGELFDFIAEKELVSEDEAIEFLQQILLGLAYMHARRIAHFDLKPENIMLLEKEAPHPKIKIIDFGLAQKLEEGVAYKSLCGTPQYIAPEVINYEALSTATDMWSIGVITYILLSGMSPFQGETDEETLSNVVSGNYEFEAKCFSQTSEMAKDFIQKLLLKEPRDRMTAAESLLHPWIKPLTRKQAVNRSRSSINMKNFRKFNARRKWKLSYHMVSACNRLCRLGLLCQQQKLEKEAAALRDCESDQEDQPSTPVVLLRRRRSICS
ncbi:death-associated protein kinase 2-like isoform 3-T3 [Vipera latastei]